MNVTLKLAYEPGSVASWPELTHPTPGYTSVGGGIGANGNGYGYR